MIQRTDDFEKMIVSIFMITLKVYLISIVIVMAFKVFFAYINGEEIFANFMLNLKPYLVASFDKGDSVYASRYGTIGVFSIHYTIIMSLIIFFMLYIRTDAYSKLSISDSFSYKLKSVVLAMVGLILTISMYGGFLFCLPEAMFVAGILALLLAFIPYKSMIKNKLRIINLYRIGLIIVSLIALFSIIIPYIGE